MVRIFSGVTKQQLFRDLWVPCTDGTQRVVKGNHTAYRVDSAGDYAIAELLVPFNFVALTLNYCFVSFIGNANIAAMKATIAADYGADAELYNQTSSSATFNTPTTLNVIGTYIISVTDILWNLQRGMRTGIQLTYNAAATPTNCDVLGAFLRYDV